jgi:hypothetical protein
MAILSPVNGPAFSKMAMMKVRFAAAASAGAACRVIVSTDAALLDAEFGRHCHLHG